MTSGVRYLPALGVMVTIFIASHIPGDKLHPPSLLGYDKFWHALEYAVLALTLLYAGKKKPSSRQNIFILFFCVAYGISDEIHQLFIPLRDASILDVWADSVGALLAICGWNFYHRRRRCP
nr:VanZ family protein [Desulfobulbaceae bacterium]